MGRSYTSHGRGAAVLALLLLLAHADARARTRDLLLATDTPTASDELLQAVAAIADTPTLVVTGGAWRLDGDAVVQAAYTSGEHGPYRLVVPTPAVADATVSAVVQFAPGGRDLAAGGLLAWMRNDGDGIGLVLDEGAGVRLVALRAGRLDTLQRAPRRIERARAYALALRRVGTRVEGLVDGVSVVDATIPEIATGGLGLVAERGEGIRFLALGVEAAGQPRATVPITPAPIPDTLAPLVIDRPGLDAPGARTLHGTIVRTVTLLGDQRASLLVPPSTTLAFPLTPDDDMVLRLDLGVVAPRQPTAGASRLEIAFESDGRQVLLGAELLADDVQARRWRPLALDLESARIGRSPGRLVLRNVPVGRGPGALVALANPVIAPALPAEAGPPNLILVVIDTLRADHLGLYGARRPTSPFLDTLATRALVFDDAVAQSSWTKTSMASLLTSTHPETNGVRGSEDVMRDDMPTVATALAAAGYFTAQVQSNPWIHPRFGLVEGFREYHALDALPAAPRVSEAGLDILHRRGGQPFFLYLHYMDVHHPYAPPAGYDEFGTDDAASYDGEIRYLDDQLRALYEALEAAGFLRNTVLVLCADHGEEFGEHGGRFHGGTLFREVIHVPLLLQGPPPIPSGVRLATRVRLLDVAPTLLALAGVPPPASFEGTPLPLDGRRRQSRTAIAQVGLNDVAPARDLLSVTSGPWTSITDRHGGTTMLFDRSRDPAETHDRAAERPDVVARLHRAASRLLARRLPLTTAKTTIDAATRERLRALGYLQ